MAGGLAPTPLSARRSVRLDTKEDSLIAGAFALATVLNSSSPFFPPGLLQPGARADVRRCTIGAQATQSDCALIGAQWVVTTAGAVASARPVAGRLHVRIGDDKYVVEQLVYHPKRDGGARYDVTLVKLASRVPEFPVMVLPGEFPVNAERIAQHAVRERVWVAQVIGPSPLWADRDTSKLATKEPSILTRVRSLMDAWSGRTTND